MLDAQWPPPMQSETDPYTSHHGPGRPCLVIAGGGRAKSKSLIHTSPGAWAIESNLLPVGELSQQLLHYVIRHVMVYRRISDHHLRIVRCVRQPGVISRRWTARWINISSMAEHRPLKDFPCLRQARSFSLTREAQETMWAAAGRFSIGFPIETKRKARRGKCHGRLLQFSSRLTAVVFQLSYPSVYGQTEISSRYTLGMVWAQVRQLPGSSRSLYRGMQTTGKQPDVESSCFIDGRFFLRLQRAGTAFPYKN